MNWQNCEKEGEKEEEIYVKAQDFIIRILKPIEFVCYWQLNM